MSVALRKEQRGDEAAIHHLTEAAFAGQEHSDGSEPVIVDRLREQGDLTLSLVAVENGNLVGHIAFSPVRISDGSRFWFGLGPVSVAPPRQGHGIGSNLVEEGVQHLRQAGANGIVLLGEPAYYRRFGFVHDLELCYPGRLRNFSSV